MGKHKKTIARETQEKLEDRKQYELTINPLFEPLFQDNLEDPRYYQVYGGRGSGKSFTVAVAMVTKTYSSFKHKILFLRQTMSSSEDSTIADVKAVIEKMGVGNDFREANGVITNISTGSTITFKGIRSTGTQTAKLKSLSGITTLVVEEAEEVESFEEFSKVDESIRIQGKPLKVILIYNPTSSIASWIHKEWFKNGVPMHERLDDTIYIHSTYLDNIENLNESVVKRYRSLERSNPTYYINTILAEWTLEVSGKIYAGWDLYPRFNNIGETWYGLDFGYGGKDKTSLIKITFFEGTYYVEEMFSVAGLKLDDTLKKFKEMEIPYSAKIYADSAMPLLIEVIRLGGYSGIRKCTKGNVDAGIKKVQNKDIVMIGSDKTGLYFAYQTFRHDKNGKLPHEPDELAALRYGINSVRPIANFKAGASLKRPMRKTRGFI
jgi:phage terminase large subunit